MRPDIADIESMLTYIGRTRSGTEIHINRHFIEADVKIATGLVENHFMAGVSGGRKAICPALVSGKTIERFHSAQFFSSQNATNLVLQGDPCHEESLEIARRTGVDFIVNTVLDRRLELIGVFSGDLEMSHDKAMVRNALVYAFHHPKWGNRKPSVALLVEGPYAIPCVQGIPS